MVKLMYPDVVPNFPPVEQISDVSFVKELNTAAPAPTKPDLPKFETSTKPAEVVVSKKNWDIKFDTGKATFTAEAEDTLKKLLNDLVIAGGTTVEIHGHTDNAGNADGNMKLSEDRAFAVKAWLEKQSPSNFPDGRVRIFAHGQTNPVTSNSTADGKAKNRRVEIVLGSTDRS